MEFRNKLLEEISKQFEVKHCFTVSYHPASNGLVERANRKIFEVLRPFVGELLETWEDWLPHIATSMSSSVCESKGQSPHFIVLGVEKRVPHDLLSSSHTSVYNVHDYVKCQIKFFSEIHKSTKDKLRPTNTAMCNRHHKRASPVFPCHDQSPGERESKVSPKFVGPHRATQVLGGHKFEV